MDRPTEALDRLRHWDRTDDIRAVLSWVEALEAARGEDVSRSHPGGTPQGDDAREGSQGEGEMEALRNELYEVKLMRELLPADSVAREILRERLRQIHKEGWSREHDDSHTDGALAAAAAWYAIPRGKKIERMAALEALGQNPLWPFREAPKKHTRRRELVIAAAMLLAEIERIDRSDTDG